MTTVVRPGRPLNAVLGTVLTAVSFLLSPVLQAQELEEVVVTAQRRVQSLQDVPISVGVFSGAELEMQGYRNFEDLSKFSPSVTVRDGLQDQTITIRGFGTEGNSLTLQQATPMFVDGIHYGRQAMIKNAFLDTERVEILKGPQPLYFGMNATAGAFNIVTRKPTPEWQGNISAEYGNNGRRKVDGGLGGPITDTLGIRVAGIYEAFDGVVKNRVSRDKGPAYNNLGGRVTLQWTPNDRLDAIAKFDISRQRTGSELVVGCLTEGSLSGFNEDTPLEGTADTPSDRGNERSVWADPPKGVQYDANIVKPTQKGSDCFKDADYGFSRGGPYLEPPLNIFEEHGKDDRGAVDAREAARGFTSRQGPNGPGPAGGDTGGIEGRDNVDSWNGLLDLTYRFDNFTVHSNTGIVRFLRNDVRDNSDSPFFMNYQGREEDYYQYSEEVRIESPASGYDLDVDIPGGLNVEGMIGGFWQQGKLDFFSSSLRANVRRAQRFNKGWEDSEWFAGFWSLTLNFMDNQLSLDIGGRYSDVSKKTFIGGFGTEWIFDEKPCDSDGTDDDPATCATDPDFKMVDSGLSTYTDPGNTGVRIDSPNILVSRPVDMNNLWTTAEWKGTKEVPRNWRGGGANPVGLTAPVSGVRAGPWLVNQHASNYDQQYVLRFSPNGFGLRGNHTFYFKYATAFKGPVTDTGQTSIPEDINTLTFAPEYSKVYELGAKGRLLNGRARYSVTLFRNKFRDLQTVAAAPIFNPQEQQTISLNAGKQDVDGVEFSGQFAVTQGLVFNMAGALMDGKMDQFDGGGCSGDEVIAASANAVRNPDGRSAEELAFANKILDTIGPERKAHALSADIPREYLINGGCRLEGESKVGGRGRETINRSGVQARRTPDWKFVFGLDYTRPVWDSYQLSFNAKGFISDSYIEGDSFNRIDHMDVHGDVNVAAGFGPTDGSWKLIAFGRNLLEATKTYHGRYDFVRDGLETTEVPDSSFTSYGLRFEYHYR